MKTIKKGRQQKGWAEEFKCTGNGNGKGGCGSVLLVEQGDLYYTYSSFCGERDTHTTFTCGECGVETDIDKPYNISDIPTKENWIKSKKK